MIGLEQRGIWEVMAMKNRLVSLFLVLALLSFTSIPALAQAGGGMDLSGLESLAIVGSGIPGIGDWDPADPAGDMTEVSPGIYTKVLAIQKDTQVTLKFAGNDQWTEEYNLGFVDLGSFSMGSTLMLSNTDTIGVLGFSINMDCHIKFTVDLTGSTPTLVMDFTDEPADNSIPEPPETSPITVYAMVPDEWTDVRIWAWDAQLNIFDQTAWPGDLVMTKLDSGWYCAQVPAEAVGVVISAYGGSVNTSDVPLKANHDIWINARYDPTSPVYTYNEVPHGCSHVSHDQQGFCLKCLEKVEHRYNNTYTCDCGLETAEVVEIFFKKTDEFSNVYLQWGNAPADLGPPDSGTVMLPDENGIYYAQVPKEADYISVSNGSDIQHTIYFVAKAHAHMVYDYGEGIWITYEQAVNPAIPVPEPQEEDDREPRQDISETVAMMVGIALLLAAGITAMVIPLKPKK